MMSIIMVSIAVGVAFLVMFLYGEARFNDGYKEGIKDALTLRQILETEK